MSQDMRLTTHKSDVNSDEITHSTKNKYKIYFL